MQIKYSKPHLSLKAQLSEHCAHGSASCFSRLAGFHGSPFRSVPILVAASFSSVLEFLKWLTIDGCLCCFQNWKQMVMVVADYHVRSSKKELKKDIL